VDDATLQRMGKNFKSRSREEERIEDPTEEV
jgi:hypothetical protein